MLWEGVHEMGTGKLSIVAGQLALVIAYILPDHMKSDLIWCMLLTDAGQLGWVPAINMLKDVEDSSQ